jgi:hypothetical protein
MGEGDTEKRAYRNTSGVTGGCSAAAAVRAGAVFYRQVERFLVVNPAMSYTLFPNSA